MKHDMMMDRYEESAVERRAEIDGLGSPPRWQFLISQHSVDSLSCSSLIGAAPEPRPVFVVVGVCVVDHDDGSASHRTSRWMPAWRRRTWASGRMTKGPDLASANDPTDSSTRASGSTTRNTATASLHSRYVQPRFWYNLYSVDSRNKTVR